MKAKYDVFISYNWKDSNFVNSLIKVFDTYNITYFLDKSNLKLYDKLSSKLKTNIVHSKYLISIVSSNYLNSYWCLFEAIEAIQSQEIKIKFLPIVLKYTIDDPSLNEDLVLEMIENISNEISSFEKRLIKNKAFELSSKLEKLNFIKSNLPKIFNQIQQNIYPSFEIWNKEESINSIYNLIKYIVPKRDIDINTIVFNIDESINSSIQIIDTKINHLPSIKWATYIGKQKWKNTPLIIGNSIYVGSAGKYWNQPDDEDGIYCINALNGITKWFFPTFSDVNEIAFADGLIVGGCDDGKLVCVSSASGQLKWEINLNSAILSRPIKYSFFSFEVFIVCTYEGSIFLIDINSGETKESIKIENNIMGNATFYSQNHSHYLFVPTVQGTVEILTIDSFTNTNSNINVFTSYSVYYPDKHSDTGYSPSCLYSTPYIKDGILIQGIVRQTSYDYPAIISFDLSKGEEKWVGSDPNSMSGYGNMRTDIIVINNEIVFTHPYSNELVGMDFDTGEVKWISNLGRPLFEQWSSPIYHKGGFFVGRCDGFLYKVNATTHDREWGIYLGEKDDAGAVFDKEQTQNNQSETTVWSLYKGYPLLATPQIAGNDLVVSTDEGVIYRISNV